tara:strand:- start:2325 stop:3143 length:819 start_codon:yes stop_codon:yes gene_type:complete
MRDDLIIATVVAIDSERRQRNYDFLKRYYVDNNLPHVFLEYSDSSYLHLQKIYNDFYKSNKEKILFKHDVDCILNVESIKKGYDLCRADKNNFVYPYDHVSFIDPMEYKSNFDEYQQVESFNRKNDGLEVEASYWPDWLTLEMMANSIMGEQRHLPALSHTNFKDMNYQSPLGYCYMFNFEGYNRGGLDNEYLLDFNFDDLERYHRLRTLGYNIIQLPGKIYHMDHSFNKNGTRVRTKDYMIQNIFEYLKIVNLNKKELQFYIETWPWTLKN